MSEQSREYGQTEAKAYALSRHGPDGAVFLDPHVSSFLEQAREKNLLDIGGGAANVGIEAIKEHGVTIVWSLDNSSAMLDQANDAIRKENLSGKIRTLLGDVGSLPFDSASHERVSSVNVGCNLDNAQLAAHFHEMSRVLTSDGQALFTVPTNLAEVFTGTDFTWPEQLFTALQIINSELLQAENPQQLIQNNLGKLDGIHRGTFAIREGKLRLVVDNKDTLPTYLKELAILEGEMTEGEPMWRKLPGLVVPNNWHTQKYYQQQMTDAGLKWSLVSDNFATNNDRYAYNNSQTDLSRQLGPSYVGKGPFAVYTLAKEKSSSLQSAFFNKLIDPENPTDPTGENLTTIANTWTEFVASHPEIVHLEKLSPEKAAQLANELILQTAKDLQVGQDEKVRLIVPNYIRSQIRHLTDGGVILKRHGQQDNSTGDKVGMMQDPANAQDHTTRPSLAEAAGDAFMLAYIAAKTHKKLAIQTSPDARAEDVAKVFELITDTQAHANELLTCMRYPDNLSQEALDLLKKNKGTVPWTQPEIDTVAGSGTFARRQKNIHNLVEQFKNPNFISLLISHSQEHQEMANNPTLRLDNLGVVIVPFGQKNSLPIVMRTGLFTQEGTLVPHTEKEDRSLPKLTGKNLLSFLYDDKELGQVVTVTLHVDGRRRPTSDDIHKAQVILSDPILQERLGQQLRKTTIISADYSLTLKQDNQYVLEHTALLPFRRKLR